MELNTIIVQQVLPLVGTIVSLALTALLTKMRERIKKALSKEQFEFAREVAMGTYKLLEDKYQE